MNDRLDDRPPNGSTLIMRELLALAPYLHQVARSLARDEDAAADLVQETWLAALRRPPRHRENLSGWLLTVARNLAFKRGQPVIAPLDDPVAESLPEREPQPDRERARELTRVVLGLREPYREVLVLRFFEQLQPNAIADRLGRSVNTVNSQLQRGLQQVRRRVERGDRSWTLVPFGLAGSLFGRKKARHAAAWVAAGLALSAVVVVSILPRGSSPLPQPTREPLADAPPGVGLSPTSVPVRSPSSRESERGAPPFARLDVLVLDAQGAPLPGATVSVLRVGRPGLLRLDSRVAGETDADGRLLVDIEAGEVGTLLAGEEGSRIGLMADWGDRMGAAHYYPAEPSGSQGHRGVTLHLADSRGVVAGRVVDELSQPVAGALVRVRMDLGARTLPDGTVVRDLARFAESGADGAFVVRGLPSGRHTVVVSAEGFSVTSLWGDTDALDELQVVLSRGASLAGVARDPDGNAVAGAVIWVDIGLSRDLPLVVSAADGSYSLPNVPVGAWRVSAKKYGATPAKASTSLAFTEGCAVRWDPVLEQPAGLALRLVDEDGDPRPGWEVELRESRATLHRGMKPRAAATADSDGWVRLFDCPEVSVVFCDVFRSRAERIDDRMPVRRVSFELPVEGTPTVVIDDEDRGELRGRVLQADGRPLEACKVWLTDVESNALGRFRVDELDGSFCAPDLPSGRYLLRAFSKMRGLAQFGEHVLEPGEVLDLGLLHAQPFGTLDLHWYWDPSHELSLRSVDKDMRLVVERSVVPAHRRFELVPGTYDVRVLRGGEVVESRRVDVASGRELGVSSGPVGTRELRFVVREAEGYRAGGPVSVAATGADGARLESPVLRSPDGSFEHSLWLSPGTWSVEAYGADGCAAPVSVTIGPEQGPAIVRMVLERR